MHYSATVFILTVLITYINAACYFPGELHGVWATQAMLDTHNSPIVYSMVNITADEISSWGKCHSKFDNKIILAGSRPSGNGVACFRCFKLVVASVNVASLISSGLESCFSSMKDALRSCPSTENGAVHIILYKVRSFFDGSGVEETQCPFSGNFYFTLSRGAKGVRGSRKMGCEQLTSEMTNCPFGFRLSLEYRDCTFTEPRADWYCLGSWDGLDGQKYTAVLDTYAREGDGTPKYKCGIYEEDKINDKVYLSFSKDSTCSNELESAKNGYERYVLHRTPLPNSVGSNRCQFPTRLRGQWHNTLIEKATITYKDETSFNTYHLQCVRDMGDSERFAVFSRTDCGKMFYNCLLIKRRSANIIELMFGEHTSDSLHSEICNQAYFRNSSGWVTQAKTNLEFPVTCPVVGTYRGELPGDPGYCAHLHSDCNREDLMFYQIESCHSSFDVYEQREYQCLGQWNEDGHVYALTLRRDINRYECFVGVVERSGVVWMKEAGGSSCKRGVSPDDFGMKVLIKSDCKEKSISPLQTDITVLNQNGRRRPTQPPRSSSATLSWKPITGRPRRRGYNSAIVNKESKLLVAFSSLLLCRYVY